MLFLLRITVCYQKAAGSFAFIKSNTKSLKQTAFLLRKIYFSITLHSKTLNILYSVILESWNFSGQHKIFQDILRFLSFSMTGKLVNCFKTFQFFQDAWEPSQHDWCWLEQRTVVSVFRHVGHAPVCVFVYLFWVCPLDCWSDGSSMMRTQDWACSKPSLLLGVFGEHWVSNIKTWDTKITRQWALLVQQHLQLIHKLLLIFVNFLPTHLFLNETTNIWSLDFSLKQQ